MASTLLYLVPLTLGLMEEKQTISLVLHENYFDSYVCVHCIVLYLLYCIVSYRIVWVSAHMQWDLLIKALENQDTRIITTLSIHRICVGACYQTLNLFLSLQKEPATSASLIITSYKVQIYSASLTIEATFSGFV